MLHEFPGASIVWRDIAPILAEEFTVGHPATGDRARFAVLKAMASGRIRSAPAEDMVPGERCDHHRRRILRVQPQQLGNFGAGHGEAGHRNRSDRR